MRNLVYSFAGCAMNGATFLTTFEPGKIKTTLGMNTDGALRLLTGNDIKFDNMQLIKLKKETKLDESYTNYNALNISEIKGIIWASIIDSTYLIPNIKCEDKTIYPIHDGALNKIFENTSASMSFDLIMSLWERLISITNKIPYKAVVNYPTNYLENDLWKSRIDFYQSLASTFFKNRGWKIFTFDAELNSSNYWSHYSDKSRQAIFGQIAYDLQMIN